MARSNFPIYFSSRRMLETLSDDQLGRVIKSAMRFAEDGTEPERMPQPELIAFEALRSDIVRDAEHYEAKCNKLRANGMRGGRPSKAENQENQENQMDIEKTRSGATPTPFSTGEAEVYGGRAPDGAADAAAAPAAESIVRFWTENGFGETMPPAIAAQIRTLCAAGCSDDLIVRALERSVEAGKPTWAYASAILQSAIKDGTLDAASFDAARASRKPTAGRNVPVDRGDPSNSDFLRNAAGRPRSIKRRD